MKQLAVKLTPYILAVLVAGASFLTGAVTTIGDAVKIALNPEQAKEACEKILEDK